MNPLNRRKVKLCDHNRRWCHVERSVPLPPKSELISFRFMELLPRGEIENCKNFVVRRFSFTQHPQRARPTSYRIYLRTLTSATGGNDWFDRNYGSHYSTYYQRSLTDSLRAQLVVATTNGVLGESLLAEGPSPKNTLHTSGNIEIKANTFDWWVPVPPPFSVDEPFESTLRSLRAFGPVKVSPPTLLSADQPLLGSLTPRLDRPVGGTVPWLPWTEGESPWRGWKTDVQEVTVSLSYRMTWDGDRFELSLSNRPEDRNYDVFLVFEELLPRSGQHLHTAIQMSIHGQITYLPQSFFDEVSKAYSRGRGILSDLNRRFSESRPLSPEDPITVLGRPGELLTPAGLQRLTAIAERDHPELLQQVVEEYREDS